MKIEREKERDIKGNKETIQRENGITHLMIKGMEEKWNNNTSERTKKME